MAIEALEKALKKALGTYGNDPGNAKALSDIRLAIEALGKEVIRLDRDLSQLKEK